MRKLQSQFGNLFAGALAILVASAAGGVELVPASPFIASGAPAAPTTTSGGPIEYHGSVAMPDGMHFSIYNTATKHADFVKLGDTSQPFVVRGYKAMPGGTDQITVDYQGSTLTLSLKRSKILNIGSPNPAGNAGTAAAATFQVPNATPMPALPPNATIEEWAAEVQRRRDDRAKADAAATAQPPASTSAPATQAAPAPTPAAAQPRG